MNWFVAFYKKYASFKGRAGRKEFWTVQLVVNILAAVALIPLISFVTSREEVEVLGVLAGIIFFPIIVAVHVRRLHDLDRSGWWCIVLFLLAPLNLLVGAYKSQAGENKYGPNPNELKVVLDKESEQASLNTEKTQAITKLSTDELRELYDLKEKGIITEEEFQHKKDKQWL